MKAPLAQSNPRQGSKQAVATLLIAVLAHWQIVQPLGAAESTWNQFSGSSYLWGLPANWSPGTGFPNAVGDIANLNNDITENVQIDLNQVITLGTLNLGDTDGSHSFTVAAGTGGYLIFDVASGLASLSKSGGAADNVTTGIQFKDDFSVANDGAGLLTLSGGLRSVSSNLTFGGSGNTTVSSSAIVTAGNLIKSGSGTLTLGVANTYAGSTSVNGGTLQLSNAAALPARSGVTVAGGATLDYLNTATTIGSLSGAGTVTASTASATRILTIGRDDTSTTFNGQFVGTAANKARLAITKAGAGTLTLAPLSGSSSTAAGDYTGATVINGGTLQLDFSQGTFTGTSMLAATAPTIAGGNLEIKGRSGAAISQALGNFTLNTTGGAIIMTPNGGASTALALGTLTFTAGTLLVQAPATTAVTTTSSLTNNIYGAGRAVFSDGAGNYNWLSNTGGGSPFTMSGLGTGVGATPAYTGALPADGSGLAAGNYALSGSQTQTAASSINTLKITSTGPGQSLNLASFNLTSNGLLVTGTDAYTISGSTGALNQSGNLYVHQYNSGGLTIDAPLSGGALVKDGSGTLTLGAGANTMTGVVSLDAGVLSFSSVTAGAAGSLGNGSATSVTIRDGATLRYTGSSGTIAATGAGSHAYSLAGGNANIAVTTAGQTLTLAGVISGAGGFTKLGAGTLSLSAAGTYTGPTYVNEGTLSIAAADLIPATPLVIGASGTFEMNGGDTIGSIAGSGIINVIGTTARTLSIGGDNTSTTFSGTFSGAAAHVLTKTGSGMLTLANSTTSAWTGGTNVNGGVLRLASSNALSSTGTMTLSLAAGPAQLELASGLSQTLGALTFYGTGTAATSQGNVLIGSGATFTLGGSLTVNNTNNPLAAVIGGTGTLSLGGATRTFDIRDSSSVPASDVELTIAANITSSGAFGFTKTALGNLLLSGTNTASGTNTFQGGTTFLDYTTNNTNKLGTGALAMQGGRLILNGNATADTLQSVASTTLASGGASSITLNAGGSQQIAMSLGAFTRAANAGTIRFNLPSGTPSPTNGFTTTTANQPSGILGAWATASSGTETGFATNSGGYIVPLAYAAPSDNVAAWAAGDNVTDSTGFTNSTAADLSIGSLRFNAAGPSTVTVDPGSILSIASGGVLQTSNVTGGTSTITGGRLTSSNLSELIFTADSLSQRIDVASAITGSNTLTKNGNGTLRLTGANNGVGTVTIQSGILELTGGSALGDAAAVAFSNMSTSPTLSLLANQTETIGSLSGGGSNSMANVSLGANSTLTVNQAAAGTFLGVYTGDSSTTLVKTGAAQHTFSGNATASFTGALVVNEGSFRLAGSNLGMIGSTAITVNNPGSEFQINFDNNNQPSRVPDAAAVTLNNTAGGNGLFLRVSHDSSRSEIIGSVVLNAGQNVITADATAANRVGTLTIGGATPLTRNNLSTALVRGRSLGDSAVAQRGQIVFSTDPGGAIGGGGLAGTTNINIYPFLVGDASQTGLGNSLVMNTGAANGLRPLKTTEYSTDAAGFNALTGSATNNVRFAANPSGALTGPATAINSLVLDSASALTITGPSSAIQITSGAILSAQGAANALGGFTGIASGAGNPYYVSVTDPAGSLTISSPLSSAQPLVKAGAGTLTLSNASNAFTNLHFNEGAVQVDDLTKLGSGSLHFFGGELQFGGVFDPSAKSTNFGTGGAIFDTNGNSITVAGAIGGGGAGGFTKTGAGTLILDAAANWTGTTTVSGGTLEMGVANAVTQDVRISGGGVLDIAGQSPSFTNLTLGSGANSVTDSAPGANSVTVSGQTTLTEGTVAPVLAGTMNLVKTGTGTATLSNPANTYTGLTWIQNGTLAISKLANAGSSSSLSASTGTNAEIFLGAGTTTGTLQYTGAPAATTNRPIVLAGSTGGGAIDSDAGGLLTMTGRAYAFNLGSKTLTLQGTNGIATAPNVFSGLIEDGYGVVGLTKANTGTWELAADNTFTGAVTVSDGRLHVTGSVANSPVSGGAATSIGNTASSKAVLYVSGAGTTYDTNTFSIGNDASGFGVLVINGADVAANSTAANGGTTMATPTTGSAYAGLFMSSGSFATQRLDLGTNGAATGTAIVQMSGGTFNWTEYILGRAGRWELTFSGADAIRTGSAQSLSLGQGTGTGAMTIAAGTVDNSGQAVAFGRAGTGGTSNVSSLNLNGGTLTTNAFTVTPGNFATGAAYLNFDGGTVRANIDTSAFLPTGLTGVYVNDGGATFDTNGKNITVASSILAPSGSGLAGLDGVNVVSYIPVADGGSGYLGAPYVEITGGGGSGATASAVVELDPANPNYGKVTGITITNPGNNYTSVPTVSLGTSGLGTGGTAATLGTITTTPNNSGGLTKSGNGTLTLSGATLGYTGPTVVNAGTLSITGSTGSAPSTLGITVAGGATLNLFNTVGQAMNALSSLSLGLGSGTATLGLELGSTSSYDSFGTSAQAAVANAIAFNISALSGFGTGSYTLLSGGAGSGFNSGVTYSFGGLPGGYTYSSVLSDTSVILNVDPSSPNPTLYWRGAINSLWGGFDGAFNSNWTEDLAGSLNANATPDPTSTVIFTTNNQSVAGTLATTLDTSFTINDLVFNSETGTGPINAITIAADASDTLTIAPSATTAGIDVQSGAPAAVSISAPVALGAVQTWNVADSGSLLTIAGLLSGGLADSTQASPASNVSLTITGNGTVDLTNPGNTFTGDILVSGATFRVDNLADWGGVTVASSTSKTITLTNGATLAVTSGTINPGGTTTSSYKLVQIGTGGGVIDTASGAGLTLDDPGQLFGSGDLTKNGNGTLILRNQTTFAGAIDITAGTLKPAGTGGVFGVNTAGTTIRSGATLDLNDQDVTDTEPLTIFGTGLASDPKGVITNGAPGSASVAGPVTLGNHATIGAAAAGSLTLSGGITGPFDLTIRNLGGGGTTLSAVSVNNGGLITNSGTGNGATTISAVLGANVTGIVQNSTTSALTLSGNNSAFYGPITIKAGTLTASLTGVATTLGDGSSTNFITLGDATGNSNATLSGVNNVTYLQNIQVAGGNTGLATIMAGTTTGAVVFAGSITLNNHDLVLSKTGTTGASQFTGGITGMGNLTISNAVTGSGTIALAGGAVNHAGSITHNSTASGTTTISANIGSNVTGIVQNSATSALTLSGTSIAYTGATTVANGILNITGATSGALSTNAIAVAGGATLNLLNSAGQSLPSLTALSLGAGSGTTTLGLELGSTAAYDSLGTGAVASVANAIRFNISSLSGFGIGDYTLLSGASGSAFHSAATYTYGGLPAGYTYGHTLSDTSVVLNVTAGGSNPALYWLGGVDTKWNGFGTGFTSNWSTDLAGSTNAFAFPDATSTVHFRASSATSATSLATTLETPFSIHDLVFNSQVGSGPISAITISAGAAGNLTIGSSGTGINVQTGAPAAVTLAAPVVLGASQVWSVADAGTTLAISPSAGGIADGGGNFGITKMGAGRLLLTSASSTFTGGMTLNEGTLAITGSGVDGSNTAVGLGGLTLNGGTFELASTTGGKTVFVPVEIGGDITLHNSSTGASDTLTFGKAVTLTGGTHEIVVTTVNGGGASISGIIGDGGNGYGITKSGAATLTLSGANTFTGDLTVKEGTLAGASTTVTNVFGGGTIRLGDSAPNASNVVLTGAISNANVANPIFLESGTSGTITLRTTNSGSGSTYTGGVQGTNNLRTETTSAGGLILSNDDFDIVGSLTNAGTGSGAVTISSNITSNVTNIIQNSTNSALNLSGSVIEFTGAATVSAGTLNVTSAAGLPSSTSISVAGGGTLNLINGVTQSLGSISGLSLGTGTGTATLGLELGNSSNYDSFGIAGAATTANTVQFNIFGLSGFGTGNYDLLSAGSGLDGATYQLGSAPGGYTYSWNNSGSLIQLQVASGAGGDIYWRGDVNSSWSNYNGGNTNWVDGSGAEFGSTPGSGNTVIFSNSSAATSISTTLDGSVSVDSIQFTATPSGVTAVTIASGTPSASSLTVANGMDVAASAGAVTISAPVVVGGNQTWNVNGSGTSSLLVSGDLSGSANLTKSGAGTLTLSGSTDSFSGGITIGGGTLAFSRTGTFTVPNLIGGSGALTKSGAGIMTLNNSSNSFAGPVTVSGGTLNFTSIGDVGGSASAMGTPATIGEGTISLAAGTILGFTGVSSQSTDRKLNLTGSATLATQGDVSTSITYNGAISAPGGSFALTLIGTDASREGAITGGIDQSGAAASADLLVNSGTWTISGTPVAIADDVIVTGSTAVLNLNGTGILTYQNNGTSNNLYSRSGATINLGADEVVGLFSGTKNFDNLILGDSGGPQAGVLNMNSYTLTTPVLQLGGYADGLIGSLTGAAGTLISSDWNLYRGSIYAKLSGSALLEKLGMGTVSIYGDNSALSGATTLQAGELVLDYSLDNAGPKVNSAGLLTINGGTLTINGNASASTSATVNGLTLGGGAQVIDVNNGGASVSATLNLGAITRNTSGGSVRFLPPLPANGAITTTRTNTSGILGAWATITDPATGATGFAANDGLNNIVLASSTVRDDVLTWLAGENVTDAAGFTGILCGVPVSPNSIRFNASGASTLSIEPGSTLTIAIGGILMTADAGGTATITGGALASGASNELIFRNDHSTHELVIASDIGGSSVVTKSGAGAMVLSGKNTYSGTTSLQQGTLILQGGNAIGDTSNVAMSDDQNVTLQLEADETIGYLSGGNANALFAATIAIDGHTLTVQPKKGNDTRGKGGKKPSPRVPLRMDPVPDDWQIPGRLTGKQHFGFLGETRKPLSTQPPAQ